MDRYVTKEEAELFLKDLEDLCQRHMIGIEGCGCDGSPYIYGSTKKLRLSKRTKIHEIKPGGTLDNVNITDD